MNQFFGITIETALIFLNLYYFGVTIALLIRDILWLRIVLIIAGGSLVTYGFMSENHVVIAWNCLFLTINTVQVIRLIIERKPVHISDDIMDLYIDVFVEMTKKEFIYFFKRGERQEITDEFIVKEGKVQNRLSLVMEGSVIITRDDHEVATLGRGRFIAEMGFITRKPATADAKADGMVAYISWSRETIDKMKRVYPELGNKLQVILAKDLIHKLADHK